MRPMGAPDLYCHEGIADEEVSGYSCGYKGR
jgi:hypothetical protein